MVKLTWRLSGNLIYHVFSMKIPDNNHFKLVSKLQIRDFLYVRTCLKLRFIGCDSIQAR